MSKYADEHTHDAEARREMRVSLCDNPPSHAPANTVAKKFNSRTIQQQFEEYHAGNPTVYQKLCEYARTAKAKGYANCGIKFLFEIIRWQEDVPGTTSQYKLCNDYTSRYARLIMKQEADLVGFFKTRSLETD